MAYIARLTAAPQGQPIEVFIPRLRGGFLRPPVFFNSFYLAAPNSRRAARTFDQALYRKEAYDADKSYANLTVYSRAFYTHNLLLCGCKYEFDSDISCCLEYPGGWLRCPCRGQGLLSGKAQYLLTFNNEFGPDVTPLVPNNCADPYEQYKDILALLYHCRSQTQHPSDQLVIDCRIKQYTLLVGQPATVKPLPIRDVLI